MSTGNPIYAYKGFVYELISNGNTEIRQMRFRESDELINLDEWGEITLDTFRVIVDNYLNTEPQ